MKLSLRPAKLLITTMLISGSLVLLHVFFWALFHFAGLNQVIFLRELFDLDLEVSIPTWYAQTQLLAAGVIAAILMLNHHARKDSSGARNWLLVALLCLFLSIDEGSGVHEQLIGIIRDQRLIGSSVNPWIIYATIILLIVGVIFVRFFLGLPRRTKFLLAMAATIFVSGAFMVDMISGGYVENTGLHKLFFIPLEEGLELAGASLLVYTLADYAKQTKSKLTLDF